MSRRKSTLNTIIDIANALPLPREVLAYPVDLAAYLCGDAPATFCVPDAELKRLQLNVSGRDIQGMLRAKGVRMWGYFVMPPPINDLMFTVKASQRDWAERLLSEAQIPYI